MEKSRPNFLVIVADDLGYSDIGCYGSEIKTPNIDQLAFDQNSLRFTSYYVAAACAPTRAMLMTGVDHHLTGLGQLPEMIKHSKVHQGVPGHEGYLVDRVVTLPELLKDAGYFTCMAGKWHLGLRKSAAPDRRGFKKSFAMLAGACNHYGWQPDFQKEDEDFFMATSAPHSENGKYVSKLPDDYYSSDMYATKIMEYLEQRTSEEKDGKPFFAYMPFTAPHWPLQAPQESVDPYRGMYDEGPAALRLDRIRRLQKAGLVPADVLPHEVVALPGEQQPWDDLDQEQKAKSARAMETYAGMVTRMDENIGRVIKYLKKIGEYDNTHILFMSDNGAEGASWEAHPVFGEHIVSHIQKYYNNSLENIGRRDSFVYYGTRWAQAATAPHRLYKMFSTEGGCRVPLVMKPAKDDSARPSAITDSFCTVQDVVPTILSLAGIDHPGTEYKGKAINPIEPNACSWAPHLADLARKPGQDFTFVHTLHKEDEPHGWEVGGSGGLRKGRYKIVFVPLPKGPQEWQLYDIIADPAEVNDLRGERPDLFDELFHLWTEYKERVGVVGVAGHLDYKGPRDEFEDDLAWSRVIGHGELPDRFY